MNRNNRRKTRRIVLGIILLLIIVCSIALYIAHAETQAETLSMIGGADGPTAILVAGNIGGSWVVPAVIGGILLIIAVFIVIAKKRHK